MALIDAVKMLCDRLAPRGWRDLLLDVTDNQLDLASPTTSLAAMLAAPLHTIRRNRPGFQEFANAGKRGVEPGQPGLSLLYHALACADVRPLRNGNFSTDPEDYPTLQELDTLENFIYSRAQRSLASFHNPVIAVCAYQYRPQALSVHRQHADLAFSRTGVARVGTVAAHYDPLLRSFEPRPEGDRGFRVLPARYAAFIAEGRAPGPHDAVLRPVPEIDPGLLFHFPVHKLFPGDECLWNTDGTPFTIAGITFHEYHLNEKLRRLHTNRSGDNPGFIPPLPIFNLDATPFVRDSRNHHDLVELQAVGASVLVVSVAAPLVQTATQRVHNTDELARFQVPRENAANRFATSLQLTFTPGSGRAAPEYANIRQEVIKLPDGQFILMDLNQSKIAGTPAAQQFAQKLARGGYEAADFIDQSCDGALVVSVPGLPLASVCAFSLVTAVDFFPQVEQVAIQEWLEQTFGVPMGLSWPQPTLPHFRQGGPKSLSDGRFHRTLSQVSLTRRTPNTTLPHPVANGSGRPAFTALDQTATAIVGGAAAGGAFATLEQPRFGTSWLPDAASDVFAPGWDVSEHRQQTGWASYASYGLGSPFPEDAKLCAALNSFWPAVAPDSSRTYGSGPTAIPLLDYELGYHPNHPRVMADEVASNRGWDGDFGPFFIQEGDALLVDCSDFDRADLTRNALDGLLGFSGLDQVTTDELIRRMEALRFCLQHLQPQSDDPVREGRAWLVTVEKVEDWSAWQSHVLPRADPQLTGLGYIYVFVLQEEHFTPFGDPPLRRRHRVRKRHEFQLAARLALRRDDNQAFVPLSR